jgi:pSer/pThr/pTyr-binding forkhead associated (FHA) protein
MTIRCPHCGAAIREAENGAPMTCWMCTTPIIQAASVPNPPTVALPRSGRRRRPGAILVPKDSQAPTQTLALPKDHVICVSVVQGRSQGQSFDIVRPLMTIGRAGGGADIEIDDPEASRVHCALEVRRETVLLQDLNSTNGTYVENSRVMAAQLESGSLFRIGDTLLQVK